jgi:hypothetical protein
LPRLLRLNSVVRAHLQPLLEYEYETGYFVLLKLFGTVSKDVQEIYRWYESQQARMGVVWLS